MGAIADSAVGMDRRMVGNQGIGPQEIGPQGTGSQVEAAVDSLQDSGTSTGVSKWSVMDRMPTFGAVDKGLAESVEIGEPVEVSAAEDSAAGDSAAGDSAAAPKVCIDADVEFTSVEVGGVSVVRCVHAGTGQHFQFGAAEYEIAKMLDGTRTVTDVVAEVSESGSDWTPQDVADLIGVLVSQKIATTLTPTAPTPTASPVSHSSQGIGEPPADATQGNAPGNKPAGVFTTLAKTCGYAISLRFPLVNAHPIAARVTPWVRPLLTRFGSGVSISFIVVSMLFALIERQRLAAEVMRIFDTNAWLVMLVGWAVLKVIHELGHACVAHYHGARCGRAGVMFFMFAPLAYVDVTDAWKLPRRMPRIAIALGGVYFELFCASIAVWVWWAYDGTLTGHFASQVFFLAGPATLLVNANPLLRLDGYYVLSDLVDVPNLREQGRRLFGGAIERRLLGMKSPKTHLAGWRRTFAAYHAAASVVFQIVWMGGLVVVVSLWAGPLGLLIAACALFLWTIVPGVKWFTKVWTYTEESERFSVGSHRRRFMWVMLTVLTVLQFLITLPSPFMVSVPVVSRFADDQVLRAPASGFVREVNFRAGDRVRTGEVLLQIANDELEVKRDEIRLELESEKIVWQRNERQASLGLAEASRRRSESLERKLVEIQEQLDSMSIKAIADGEIITPKFEELGGTFIAHGHELAQIGNRDRKELLLSIGEEEMDAYVEAVQQGLALRVCFRGGQWVDVVPQKLLPRASRSVPHPALAATVGGPLPVVPLQNDQGSDLELLSPRFEAVVALPPGLADSIRCGEVGEMALQDQRSMARRLWQWLKNDSGR